MAKEDIEKIIGQELGPKRAPREPVLEAFRNKGVPIADLTVGRLRAERRTGNTLLERLTAGEILQGERRPLKNEFMSAMSQAGIDLRSYQVSPNSHKLSSEGYTQDIADALGISRHAVDHMIRGARLDFIYSEVNGEYTELPEIFSEMAKAYLKAFVEMKGTVPNPPARKIYEEWDRQTMRNFYSLLDELGARARGTWVPYEVSIIHQLYQERQSFEEALTLFDRKVLTEYRDGNPFSNLVPQLESMIGQKLDTDVLEDYKSVLIYGQPVPPA